MNHAQSHRRRYSCLLFVGQNHFPPKVACNEVPLVEDDFEGIV